MWAPAYQYEIPFKFFFPTQYLDFKFWILKNAALDVHAMEASSKKILKAQQNKEKEKIKNEAWGQRVIQ